MVPSDEALPHTDELANVRQLRTLLAPEGGWLLVEEVMAMLGVSKQRVSQLVCRGRLNAKRHGRRVLIEEASVLSFRDARRQHGGRPPSAEALAMPDGCMLPGDAARLLGRSRRSVLQLIRRGILSAREGAPRRVIVERASVEATCRDGLAAPGRLTTSRPRDEPKRSGGTARLRAYEDEHDVSAGKQLVPELDDNLKCTHICC